MTPQTSCPPLTSLCTPNSCGGIGCEAQLRVWSLIQILHNIFTLWIALSSPTSSSLAYCVIFLLCQTAALPGFWCRVHSSAWSEPAGVWMNVRWTRWLQMRWGSECESTPRRPRSLSPSLWSESAKSVRLLSLLSSPKNMIVYTTKRSIWWHNTGTNSVVKLKWMPKNDLLWRDVKGHSSQIHLHEVISAG